MNIFSLDEKPVAKILVQSMGKITTGESVFAKISLEEYNPSIVRQVLAKLQHYFELESSALTGDEVLFKFKVNRHLQLIDMIYLLVIIDDLFLIREE